MKTALAVVAHPDDETIWMGGTILRNRKWEWTIAALCRRGDSDRQPRFERACKLYKAKHFISNLEDEHPEQPLTSLDAVTERLLAMLKQQRSFDFIFTHGNNGEYQHNRHMEVYAAVRKLLHERMLACKKLFCFAYKFDAHKKKCVPIASASEILRLNTRESRRKKFIIKNVYGFTSGSFEERSSSSVEAFKVIMQK